MWQGISLVYVLSYFPTRSAFRGLPQNVKNPKMQMRSSTWISVAGMAALLVGCSGGSSSPGSVVAGGDFIVLRTEPANNGKLFLNESIRIDFSNNVDLKSADLNTISFQVFDLNGVALSEQPQGAFELAASTGDDSVGRQLRFSPRFPTNDTYDNGGFRPGRRYVVQLVGGESRNGTVLTDTNGKGLTQPVTFEFTTSDGSTPSQLFRDTLPGGPRRVGFEVSPIDASGVGLSHLGQSTVEVRLRFDQPLNPNSANIPVHISPDPTRRSAGSRGRLYLEYDSGTAKNTWLPATVDLEVNALSGAEVVLRPIGVLPNNAEIRVVVGNTVEDMSGESNVSDASYDRVFATFSTRKNFEVQYDAVVENFRDSGTVDFDAPFLEPPAAIKSGHLMASFDYDGSSSNLEYEPNAREVILNTDFTQITPKGTPPINIAGGVFRFKRVTIPAGVLVRGTGTNPMVWLCNEDFIVNGDLSVDGGFGGRVDTLNSANVSTPGGIGVCGGGNGGKGSPNGVDRSFAGEPGFGPFQKPATGGAAGRLSCQTSCGRGSGGGGGAFATLGDPYYPPNVTAGVKTGWTQLTGEGSPGCTTGSLAGGSPGASPFVDSRSENDFWGEGVNVYEQIRIRGELFSPVGGAGGGGGGDNSTSCKSGDPGFINDNRAGGGGAGAGILIIKALGKIQIGRNGHISATGGNGGGGEQSGSNNKGGGGGAGSGGMVILMAGEGMDIEVHGTSTKATYGENDYDFAVAADGGICLQGRYSGYAIDGKYANGVVRRKSDGDKPTGGYGGLGVVQIMVPPGDDSDGTGNRLDDFISFTFQGALVKDPARKKELLAWRGWLSNAGLMVDDDGNPTNIGDNEGDIRPSPVLLPVPFSAYSRARSRWIDTGASARTLMASIPGPNTPGVVVGPAKAPNPDWEFAGTTLSGTEAGYVAYSASGAAVYPDALPADVAIVSMDASSSHDGQPAYQVDLAAGSITGDENRFVHYRAALKNSAGTTVGEFRILSHNDRTLFLSTESGTLPVEATKMQIVAKFFQVVTGTEQGLGPTFTYQPPVGAKTQVPVANIRFGFAFHTDPSGPNGQRFPSGADFIYDLSDSTLQTWLDTNRPTFVQWDALFNSRYYPTNGNRSSERLDPDMALQKLDFVVLPFRW